MQQVTAATRDNDSSNQTLGQDSVSLITVQTRDQEIDTEPETTQYTYSEHVTLDHNSLQLVQNDDPSDQNDDHEQVSLREQEQTG